jgi:hypothetical protein
MMGSLVLSGEIVGSKSEFLTGMLLKIQVFWDGAPYGLVNSAFTIRHEIISQKT